MVLCSGAFDGVHAGHVRYLRAAKALCLDQEVLVCAIAPDAYILEHKGREPYWSQADRRYTVDALMTVDAAVAQDSHSAAPMIRRYRPRLFVKGSDWYGRIPDDIQLACVETGTTMVFVETPGRHVAEAHRGP